MKRTSLEKYESDLWRDYYDRFNIPNINFKTLDLEEKIHNFSYEDETFNSVYARFVLHAVPEPLEDYILINSNRVLKNDGLLFIETRSDKGEVSDFADKHYRRLINIDTLIEKLTNLNFEIKFKQESSGLSIYKGDDPILIRIIAKKKGKIKIEDEDVRSRYLNPETSKYLLLKTKYVFDTNNITFLLLFGTLLGAYRDKNFINPDTDVDLGLFQNDIEKVEELINEGYFAIYGIYKLNSWWENEDQFIKLQYKKDEIDFYFFQKKNDIYEFNSNNVYYFIPKDQIDNELGKIEFLGENFSTVNDIEKYLTRVYGEWQTPKFNYHAPDEKGNKKIINHNNPKINISLINGPIVEILDNVTGEYDVEFIDLENNESIYQVKIKNNQWCKPNVKGEVKWAITVDGIDNDFHYEYKTPS